MGLGFSKLFAVVILFSAAYAYWLHSFQGFFAIIIPYAIIKLVWNLITQK